MLDKDAIKTEITRNSIYVDGGIDHIKDDYIEVTLGDTLKVYDAPYLSITNPLPKKKFKRMKMDLF